MKLYEWLLQRVRKALKKAYEASKEIKTMKQDFSLYKKSDFFDTTSWENSFSYIDFELNKYKWIIKYSLFKYRVSVVFLLFLSPFEISHSKDSLYFNILHNKKIHMQLSWIKKVIDDIETWQKKKRDFFYLQQTKNKQKQKKFHLGILSNIDSIAYETIGFIPRSITRTLYRFKTELTGKTALILFREFRFAKYQALASIQYGFFLLLLPWIVTLLFKKLSLEYLMNVWWNKSSIQLFNASQKKIALKRFQNMEDIFWLDLITKETLENKSQYSISLKIHDMIISLVEIYTQKSIYTIIELITDFIGIFTITVILCIAKKRLTVLNSWLQELFYSLSDTMKAFFILLITDLCIGFHSPHGWEVLIELVWEHFGFVPNQYITSFFVSTFPVVLDTMVKYWIFRHLNRISPSIVVTYHSMNE
uniref:Potassium/proton antiporter CemA n=1 Tax=Chara vulgaris TaxID=55564 RepID=CEMA_CHAVU|nr:envelope membrane protein [Chara vulgaris]Q1ACJ1.1 RecName: Full=Potassium/proton antiporter CemA; AltName: Full=Chloroplast envelope membrane protein A; Short=CemA [Chara vulgaris]ABA61908.1 chloroplast envelope membrane protein [Chara vulgaris]WAP91326.1 chloroplast envelope membrane protein [Chara vulgaris]